LSYLRLSRVDRPSRPLSEMAGRGHFARIRREKPRKTSPPTPLFLMAGRVEGGQGANSIWRHPDCQPAGARGGTAICPPRLPFPFGVNVRRQNRKITLLVTKAMNSICPYCGEPQRFPVMWMDCVVACKHCARAFLLSDKPRDQVPVQRRSLPAIQACIDRVFWTIVILVIILAHILMFSF
jgi:hypothetical protein